MARPLRLEIPGALYHVTARGNRRESIYQDDKDWRAFLFLLGDVCKRNNWCIHAMLLKPIPNRRRWTRPMTPGNIRSGRSQITLVCTTVR